MPVDAPLPARKRQKKHKLLHDNHKNDTGGESKSPEAKNPTVVDNNLGPSNHPNHAKPPKPPKPPLPLSLPNAQPAERAETENEVREELVKELVRHLGLHRRKIEEALDATVQDGITYEKWSDEAQVYLATVEAEAENEQLHEAEKELLAEGMSVSLLEAEYRRAKERPLHEQTLDELSDKFKHSAMYDMLLSESQWERLMNCQDVRKAVVEYLKMEQNCKQWFRGIEAYFCKVAAEMHDLMNGGRIPINDEEVKTFLETNTQLLEAEVFQFPRQSDGQLPKIFAAYVEEQEIDLTGE